jgi:putative ABC transport system permease protein
VRRLIHNRVPELLLADATDLVQLTERIASEAAQAMAFCAAVVLLAAACLLFGVTRVLRFFREHDVAVLRAIGARPRAVLVTVLLEYGILGGVAGLIGVLLGTGAITAVLAFVTGSVKWIFDAPAAAVAVAATGAIAGLVGLWGSRSLLDSSPLDMLRRR